MDLIRLDTLEVFHVVEQFIRDAEERELDLSIPMLDRLPRKNVRSRTAREVQEALAKRMLAKYEAAITEIYDLRTESARNLGKAFEPPHLTDSPNVLRRHITDCDRRIASLIEEAHIFALQFGWSLTGGFEPETKEYKFEISKMSEVFQQRRAA
jgi:hypothetical protein